MNLVEQKILYSLERHGVLSQSSIYRNFHRYRADKKNAALIKLLKAGLIKKEVKHLGAHARKPTHLFALTQRGEQFLREQSQSQSK